MHHIVRHQHPEGGRGEGDDNEAEGTMVPQPADPPNVFKVSVASVKPGHENLPPLVLGGMTTRPRGGLVIVAMGGSCCG